MAASNFTEFNLPKQAYAAFDATSLRDLIVQRLRNSGLFPDVDYNGSNISGLIDVVAYTYHVLLFYLNNTASESLFNQAELYENINKIVSLIGYKPMGPQTAILNFSFTLLNTLPQNFYTLKRYSNLSINGVSYSFKDDIYFEKTTTTNENVDSVGENNFLFQGIYREYPLITAIGENFEQYSITTISPNTSESFVDYNNIDVYVLDTYTNIWYQWSEVETLFFATITDRVFEKRYNENGIIEIKFGNNINGKRLNLGDLVAIYYLESNGIGGLVGPNSLNSNNINLFNTSQFNSISTDIFDNTLNFINSTTKGSLYLQNIYSSTSPTIYESVESIRSNAPVLFAAQNRLVTVTDYEAYILKNFSNLITDAAVINNQQYVSEYLKYYFDIGLERPNDDARVLLNQVSFNDSCDFNNVYCFTVPLIAAIINETTPNYLNKTLKQLIINKLNTQKIITQNVVLSDPVYQAFTIGISKNNELPSSSTYLNTKIIITRNLNSVQSKEQIKNTFCNKIIDFFNQSNNKLGQFINLAQLNVDLLSIDGVREFKITNGEIELKRLNVIYWNPTYEKNDITSTSQNIQLAVFKFPFLYKSSNLKNQIEIV
tara:strand:- start:15697 stop:17502 length:1806 start_codon:yes stop_codon:yes gene_type:complete